jgi:hypothetical protein
VPALQHEALNSNPTPTKKEKKKKNTRLCTTCEIGKSQNVIDQPFVEVANHLM